MGRTVVLAFSARLGALVSGLRREPRLDSASPKSGIMPIAGKNADSAEETRAVLQELLVEDFTCEEDRWTWR